MHFTLCLSRDPFTVDSMRNKNIGSIYFRTCFLWSGKNICQYDIKYLSIGRLINKDSKQTPNIHRKEILCIDSSISYDKGRLRMKEFPEHIQSRCALFRIAFNLNSDYRTFFT